jgi:acetoacetyl-CoA synthetase
LPIMDVVHGVGEVLWTPSPELQQGSELARYLAWLQTNRGLRFDDYAGLWEWSTTDLEGFWSSLWDFFEIRSPTPYRQVLDRRTLPGAEWFAGARLNYAAQVFRHSTTAHPAILFRSERHPLSEISWAQLERRVAAVAESLRRMGVGRGDRVVAYLPNIPETVVAFLATASLGAIWSSCSPEFGTGSVIDRFRQIEPKVLIAVDGYQYNGKRLDRLAEVEAIRAALPNLAYTVLVSYLDESGEGPTHAAARGFLPWSTLLEPDSPLQIEDVPFDHPLWILYSSGTTGLPKAIVHGHGGVILERMKVSALQHDVQPGDRGFWFTTTGWVMWNGLVGGLLGGSTIVLYDGSPSYPNLHVLWELAAQSRMTSLGTSPAFLASCMKAGLRPGEEHDLSSLKMLGVTGSPLPPDAFDWVYENVKRDVWLCSLSGGTDVASCFVGGCPLLPVRRGEIQCRVLGARVEAWDEQGQALQDEVGELVVTEPIPSMPLFFWNDPGGERYRASYFDKYPGVWRHGDWIRITPSGGAIIYGRSDSTLNRMGVRMGAGDIYRVVDGFPEVADSLVVGVELPGGGYYMPLFVALASGGSLDPALESSLRERIRTELSPRHVPDEIVALPQLPRTLNGKRLEVPVKRILSGVSPAKAVNPDSITHPQMIEHFASLAARLPSRFGLAPADTTTATTATR